MREMLKKTNMNFSIYEAHEKLNFLEIHKRLEDVSFPKGDEIYYPDTSEIGKCGIFRGKSFFSSKEGTKAGQNELVERFVFDDCFFAVFGKYLILSGKESMVKFCVSVIGKLLDVYLKQVTFPDNMLKEFESEAILIKKVSFNGLATNEIKSLNMSGDMENVYIIPETSTASIKSMTGIFEIKKAKFGISFTKKTFRIARTRGKAVVDRVVIKDLLKKIVKNL